MRKGNDSLDLEVDVRVELAIPGLVDSATVITALLDLHRALEREGRPNPSLLKAAEQLGADVAAAVIALV